MAKTEYFELGALSKPHGLKGAFHVYLDVDDPYEYEDLESVFVQMGNELVPYFIEDIQIRDNLNLLVLEGIESLDAAKELVGKKLFLPVSFLPKLKDDQYYYHEIIDYQVVDKYNVMQIDLQETMQITKVIQDGNSLKFEREGNVFHIYLTANQNKGDYKQITVFYNRFFNHALQSIVANQNSRGFGFLIANQ